MGRGTSCYPCVAQKIRCAPSTEQGVERGVSEVSNEADDMPKAGGSKGKWRMVGSEELEGLRPKRAKVEVSMHGWQRWVR